MGDEPQADALARLSAAHTADLLRFVRRMTGDAALAQDIVQEAMLRAWSHPAVLDAPDHHARSWLFAVARHLAIDARRSAYHRRELVPGELPDIAVADRTGEVVDARVVFEAIAALTPAQQRTVVDLYYRRLTIAEIADAAGVPPGTVKSRLHHALHALRSSLDPHGD